MRFLIALLRAFPTFVRVTLARHRGLLPARVGVQDHEYSIRLQGPNGENDMLLKGLCSRIEAARLMGFLSVYETPLFGCAVRDGAMLQVFTADHPGPTIAGPHEARHP